MKIIRLLIVAGFLSFSLGFHAFAGEGENHCKTESPAHHCVLVCHAGCHTAEAPTIALPAPSYQAVAQTTFFTLFNYENPSLLGFKRPPIYLS